MSGIAIAAIVVFSLLAIAAFLFFTDVFHTLRAVLRRPQTGKEALRGKTAVVRKALLPKGTVMLDGELWTAVSDGGPVEPGETVRVDRVENLTLHVTGGKERTPPR
jgi:membrane-bound serine protease (ClpP class)